MPQVGLRDAMLLREREIVRRKVILKPSHLPGSSTRFPVQLVIYISQPISFDAIATTRVIVACKRKQRSSLP